MGGGGGGVVGETRNSVDFSGNMSCWFTLTRTMSTIFILDGKVCLNYCLNFYAVNFIEKLYYLRDQISKIV